MEIHRGQFSGGGAIHRGAIHRGQFTGGQFTAENSPGGNSPGGGGAIHRGAILRIPYKMGHFIIIIYGAIYVFDLISLERLHGYTGTIIEIEFYYHLSKKLE